MRGCASDQRSGAGLQVGEGKEILHSGFALRLPTVVGFYTGLFVAICATSTFWLLYIRCYGFTAQFLDFDQVNEILWGLR